MAAWPRRLWPHYAGPALRGQEAPALGLAVGARQADDLGSLARRGNKARVARNALKLRARGAFGAARGQVAPAARACQRRDRGNFFLCGIFYGLYSKKLPRSFPGLPGCVAGEAFETAGAAAGSANLAALVQARVGDDLPEVRSVPGFDTPMPFTYSASLLGRPDRRLIWADILSRKCYSPAADGQARRARAAGWPSRRPTNPGRCTAGRAQRSTVISTVSLRPGPTFGNLPLGAIATPAIRHLF